MLRIASSIAKRPGLAVSTAEAQDQVKGRLLDSKMGCLGGMWRVGPWKGDS